MARSKEESPFTLHSAEFREKASDLGKDVKELGKLTKNLAQDAMGVLGENANEYYEQGVEKAKALEKNLATKIQEKPMQSLLIAAGIGLVIGMLWRRK